MSFCREWSLVKYEPEQRHIKPLCCRSWGCEYCQPNRRNQLMATAASGLPNRFLTLTVNPQVGADPEERLHLLAHAWRVVVQRLRRRYGADQINYFAVVEETKHGEPHLHILLRSPYIPQSYISAAMADLINAPIVDIRRIKTVRDAVTYVAKYIAKAPAQFGKAKRYWSSRNWEVGAEEHRSALPLPSVRWRIDRRPLQEILLEWFHEGYAARRDRGDVVIGLKVWPPPLGGLS